MPDINLTIDGKPVTVPAGTLIVEAAKTVGIEIPVFCYHHKLDPVGACRLCLVDFSPGPPRPQTACTTPVSDKIALDRERCVLCYRCTRYYDEIAWEQELTTDERGVQSFITSRFDQPLQSIFSGNIIDLCPVGALTSRVWRFESRPWDMTHSETICSKCAVG